MKRPVVIASGIVTLLIAGLNLAMPQLTQSSARQESFDVSSITGFFDQRTADAPARLRIPSLKIDAAVEHVGLDADKNMDVPKDTDNVAWYEPGPRPGEEGSAVLAGHFDSDTGPAVFWRLQDLKIGEDIEVIDVKGKSQMFRVIENEKFEADNAPMEKIFAKDGRPILTLITCGGLYDEETKEYSKRRVVFAEIITE